MTRQNWRLWAASIDVDKILEQPETQLPQRAKTFGGENLEHRISQVAWMSDNETVRFMLEPYILEAQSVMNVDVDCHDVEIQYTEYHASEGGKYDWHHDVDWNNNNGTDRKLSLTVQLSDPNDYDGGNFEFAEVEQLPDSSRKQGTVVVFPSYLAHRVTPVTRGVRRSLVAWFSGPTWR